MTSIEAALTTAFNSHQNEQAASSMSDAIYSNLTGMGYSQEIANDVANIASARLLELTSPPKQPDNEQR